LKVVVVAPVQGVSSETFIRAHIERLPFQTIAWYGMQTDLTDSNGHRIWWWGWWFRAATRRLAPKMNAAVSAFFLAWHLKSTKADAVLAEYGTTGAWLAPACARVNVPLFVHFHGYDAWRADVLEAHRSSYRRMFEIADGIIVVSEPMRDQVISLGATPDQISSSPCGVKPELFAGAQPARQPPRFLAVGRFVEKKAPYLTLLAFAKIYESNPAVTLTMIGTGPLLGSCKRLSAALGLGQAVSFLGNQTPERVAHEMQDARAFVQHSLMAENGDCEGTPVAVIEAQMTGLPVVSTRHAGIPQVVLENETGFLVEEGDIQGMAEAMQRLAESPELAARLGEAARLRALHYFTLDRHIRDLTRMIETKLMQ
jgi:colanic acid/amylovoran biosynthesis glycosyltransferase